MADVRTGEIDLIALFLRLVRITVDNFWLILVFFVLGTALGFGYYYTSKKVFENKMIVSSTILTESYSKKLVENISQYLAEGNTRAVMDQLGVSEKTAQRLSAVRIESPYQNEAEVAKEEERKYFVITVNVFDQDILPDLQKGLINYFENNEFVKIRVNQRKTLLQQLVANLNREIADLEILKTKINNGEFFQNTKGNVMFDPTVVNTKILDLSRDRLNIQNDLELVNSVQLMEGFTPFKKPVKPRFYLSVVAGSSFGIFFVAILLGFKSVRKLLRMEEESRKAA